MSKIFLLTLVLSTILFFGCENEDIALESGEYKITIFGKVTNSKTGEPLIGVVVSDGFRTSVTNIQGKYSFIGNSSARHIFLSIPEYFEIPIINGMPTIFKEIDTNNDSIETNFQLTPLQNGIENEFTLFSVADPQVLTISNIQRFVNETIKDLKDESVKYKNVYGITLGDLVDDKPELFSEIRKTFIDTKIPFFHTIGNHDFSENLTDPLQSRREYENYFGPVNYSFNRGNAHVVVMNNVLYKGNRSFNKGFTESQIEWLKSDLNYVSKNKLLIICYHIPLRDDENVKLKNEFLDVIKAFNEVHLISGHSHLNQNFLHDGDKIFEHITGAASGIWWSGIINRCGAPHGYSVYHIENNSIKKWYYKSTNFDKDYQVKIYAPYTFGDASGYVVANVWNASPGWKIELFEDGINRGEMEQFTDYDPNAYELIKSTGRAVPGSVNASVWYAKTNHLYRLKPQNAGSSIYIRVTDIWGDVYIQDTYVKSTDEAKKY